MADVTEFVRTAREDDAEAVWHLVGEFATSFRPSREPFELAFARAVRDPSSLVLVAVGESGAVCGYLLAGYHPTFFANAPVAWIEEIMVDGRHRRNGLGRALMDSAETWAWERGAAYVSLATRRAAGFYSAIGYEESAVFFRKLRPAAG